MVAIWYKYRMYMLLYMYLYTYKLESTNIENYESLFYSVVYMEIL